MTSQLVPDSPLSERCTRWLQELILGIAPRPSGGRASYELATNAERWPELNAAIADFAHARLGSSLNWSGTDTWTLLTAIVDTVEPTDSAVVDLYAVRVLLNRIDAPSLDETIPGSDPNEGITLEYLRKSNADIARTATFEESVTLRKAYLLALYDVKAVGSFRLNTPIMRRMADTLLRFMLNAIEHRALLASQAHELKVREPSPEGGWGPQRPVYPALQGSPYAAFNNAPDNPNLGDERAFIALRKLPEPGWDVPNVWFNDTWVKPGERYLVRMYVRNGCEDEHDNVRSSWIYGAQARLFLMPGEDRVAVYGVLAALNAQTVWDGATLHFDPGVHVEFDHSTAKIENNAHPGGGLPLGPDLFASHGTMIGYHEMDGVVRPGFQYAAYLSVVLRVVEAQ